MASVTLRYALPDLWDALLKYVQLSPMSANNGGDVPTTPASKKELKKKEKEDRKKEKEKEKEEKKKEKEEKKKAKERGN